MHYVDIKFLKLFRDEVPKITKILLLFYITIINIIITKLLKYLISIVANIIFKRKVIKDDQLIQNHLKYIQYII